MQCPRQLTRRERAADMFPLTVSPKRATKSTGSFVNLCTAAPSPKKKVRLATAEILGVTPLSAITSAACPAPPAALAGEAATLHHEGLKTTYPPHLLCNSSHVTACPFKLVSLGIIVEYFSRGNQAKLLYQVYRWMHILLIFLWQRLSGGCLCFHTGHTDPQTWDQVASRPGLKWKQPPMHAFSSSCGARHGKKHCGRERLIGCTCAAWVRYRPASEPAPNMISCCECRRGR